ncbi:NAD(+)/NADH kinase [Natronosalvus caseinilyticus]|uniref:NAD(+)/NADH kinase n=1 Tax=Natronosalvus caseinilyticus TaxID=2953747 RepID=UPI0028A69719|nr:NAD(+)/NADH kinase [Natronosalvus caseinilyticus]
MGVDVGIVAQRGNDRAQRLAASLIRTVHDHGDHAVVDEATGRAIDADSAPLEAMNDCAFVVSIGGDGTFLFTAREAGGAPLVGVNLGEVGFLNAISPADAVETVETLLEEAHETGSITGRSVARLTATGNGWTLAPALNEVVVHGPKRGPAGGVDVEVAVDGETYTTSRADGVLVSTATGSTAYNLSEGGPLVRPTVDAFVVTQMCATEAMPPLVVGAESEITLTASGAETAWAISDGRNRQPLDLPETITVRAADDPITLAGPSVNFFDALEKLE